MAITLALTQNTGQLSRCYGKWYPRVKYGKLIDLDGLAKHIHQHYSIYPEELVRGVLQNATRCTRELMLEGYPVKFDGLGIFEASVENVNGFDSPADATLTIGGKDSNGKPLGIQSIKMVCQATAEFTKKELSGSSILQWSDLAQKTIADDKAALASQQAGDEGDDNGDNNG